MVFIFLYNTQYSEETVISQSQCVMVGRFVLLGTNSLAVADF